MSADLLPAAAHIDALRTFLDARNDEAYQEARGPAASLAIRTLFGTLASRSIGYTAASLLHDEPSWLEGTNRRWWLLLQIADAYKDHPDFPDAIRPFLDAPAWR